MRNPNFGPPDAGWAHRSAELRLRLQTRLHEEDFEQLDTAVVQAAEERLVAAADLLANLRHGIGAFGKMQSTYRRQGTASGVRRSMHGRGTSILQRTERDEVSVPIPILDIDFDIPQRELDASAQGLESLDVSEARAGSRAVSEDIEDLVLNGGFTHAGNSVHGYTDHPDRNTVALGTAWDAEANPGDAALADVLAGLQAASDVNYNGPFWLYVAGNYGDSVLEDDFKAETEATVRQRLEAISKISAVRVADRLADDNVVLVQATSDVVDIAVFSEPDLIEEELQLAFAVQLKIWAALAPRVKSDKDGNSGVVHIS